MSLLEKLKRARKICCEKIDIQSVLGLEVFAIIHPGRSPEGSCEENR